MPQSTGRRVPPLLQPEARRCPSLLPALRPATAAAAFPRACLARRTWRPCPPSARPPRRASAPARAARVVSAALSHRPPKIRPELNARLANLLEGPGTTLSITAKRVYNHTLEETPRSGRATFRRSSGVLRRSVRREVSETSASSGPESKRAAPRTRRGPRWIGHPPGGIPRSESGRAPRMSARSRSQRGAEPAAAAPRPPAARVLGF